MTVEKPFSPACERNRGPILEVLRERLADRRQVLEIGSGTGQHAVHFAAALPHLVWQTSDVASHLGGIRMWLDEAALTNTPPPLTLDVNDAPPAGRYDAVFSANTLHIMGWPEVQRLFTRLPALMTPGALLTIYGPFKRDGRFSSASDAEFDAQLREDDPRRGIRDIEAVDALATVAGLALLEDRPMPANNRCVTWQRRAFPADTGPGDRKTEPPNDPPHAMTTAPNPQTLRSHCFSSLQPGARLIVLGAVHGNETCGSRAIERVLAELDAGSLDVVRGSVTFVPVTNALAYQRGQRVGERNLNRNLRPNPSPVDHEDRIGNVLCPLLAQHDVLLDLHSFHSPGAPFAMIGPPDNAGALEPFARAAQEEALALRLGPRRLVEGWLDTYAVGVKNRLQRGNPEERSHMLSTEPSYGVGTTEYMRSVGGCAITLECGQHDEAQAVDVAYRAIRNTLAHLRLTDEPAPPPCADPELLRLTEVTDRHHADDQFARTWASYDRVGANELVGTRHDGTPVRAPSDGFIVFPNPKALPGNEWFYFAQLSTRRLRAGP